MTTPKETIFVPFIWPLGEVISSLPYKFVMDDFSFEFFARHTVKELDDDKAIPVVREYDTQVKMTASSIMGFEMYRSTDHPSMYIFKITGATGEISMYFDDKLKATELYNTMNKWLFNENS